MPDSPEIQSSVPADHVSHVGVGPRANHDNYFTIESQKTLGLGSWEEVLEQCNRECDNVPSHANMEGILQKNNIIYDELGANEAAVKEDPGSSLPLQLNWQVLISVIVETINCPNLDGNVDLLIFQTRKSACSSRHCNFGYASKAGGLVQFLLLNQLCLKNRKLLLY